MSLLVLARVVQLLDLVISSLINEKLLVALDAKQVSYKVCQAHRAQKVVQAKFASQSLLRF